MAGFDFKGLFLTIAPYLRILVVLILTGVIAKITRGALSGFWDSVAKRMRMNRTHYVLIEKLISAGIWFLGIALCVSLIPGIKEIAIALFAGAGVLAIIVGLATQKAAANLIAGIFIAIFKPFRVGDRVVVEGQYGLIEDITLYHTVIKTWEHKRLVVPNSVLHEQPILNYSKNNEYILNGIEYWLRLGSDVEVIKKAIVSEIVNHPDFVQVNSDNDYLRIGEPVQVRIFELGDYEYGFKAFFWTKDFPSSYKMMCDVYENLAEKFKKRSDVEIIYPTKNLILRPELLKQAGY